MNESLEKSSTRISFCLRSPNSCACIIQAGEQRFKGKGKGGLLKRKGRDNHLEGVAAVGEPEGVGAKVAALVLREEEVHVLMICYWCYCNKVSKSKLLMGKSSLFPIWL